MFGEGEEIDEEGLGQVSKAFVKSPVNGTQNLAISGQSRSNLLI